MMSYDKPIERYFVDLLFTINTGSGFQGVKSINPSLFEDYLRLCGKYDSEKLNLVEKFELITREEFQQEYPTESWPNVETEAEWLCDDFQDIIADSEELIKFEQYKDENLAGLYNYYHHKTGALPNDSNDSVLIKCLSDEDYVEIERILLSLGKKVLKGAILRKVRNKLRRDRRYISSGKKIVDKPSEACKEAYYNLVKESWEIDSDILFKRVRTNYVINDYIEHAPNVARKKLKVSVNSWYHRNIK